MPPREVHAKPKKPIRETITYPALTVTEDNDACLTPWNPYEHVLSCGHLITTALPDQPCAPNCHHVAHKDGSPDYLIHMRNGKKVSIQKFYCDACMETALEGHISDHLTAAEAEKRMAWLRAEEARMRGKATKFRKCYIALKITSVSCHSDGRLSSRYQPTEDRHPFDLSLPRSGDNMFEDVDPEPEVKDDEAGPIVSEIARKRKASVSYAVEEEEEDDEEVENVQRRKRPRMTSGTRRTKKQRRRF
jgi:hypothetical protein